MAMSELGIYREGAAT